MQTNANSHVSSRGRVEIEIRKMIPDTNTKTDENSRFDLGHRKISLKNPKVSALGTCSSIASVGSIDAESIRKSSDMPNMRSTKKKK
jgi:hypothetical protein